MFKADYEIIELAWQHNLTWVPFSLIHIRFSVITVQSRNPKTHQLGLAYSYWLWPDTFLWLDTLTKPVLLSWMEGSGFRIPYESDQPSEKTESANARSGFRASACFTQERKVPRADSVQHLFSQCRYSNFQSRWNSEFHSIDSNEAGNSTLFFIIEFRLRLELWDSSFLMAGQAAKSRAFRILSFRIFHLYIFLIRIAGVWVLLIRASDEIPRLSSNLKWGLVSD
jgi:hypothetical protein